MQSCSLRPMRPTLAAAMTFLSLHYRPTHHCIQRYSTALKHSPDQPRLRLPAERVRAYCCTTLCRVAPRCAVLHRRRLPTASARLPLPSLRRLPRGASAALPAGRARRRAAGRRSAAVCAVCADLAGLVAVGDGGRRHAVLGPHRADLRRRAGLVWLGVALPQSVKCHVAYSMQHTACHTQHSADNIQNPANNVLDHTLACLAILC